MKNKLMMFLGVMLTMGMFGSKASLAEDSFKLEPVYLKDLKKVEAEEVPIKINDIDTGLKKTFVTVKGIFRSLEGDVNSAKPEDLVVSYDKVTRIRTVFLKINLKEFDGLVGTADKEKTIRFGVPDEDKKIFYIAAWPNDRDFLQKLIQGDFSIDAPRRMTYFRFEVAKENKVTVKEDVKTDSK